MSTASPRAANVIMAMTYVVGGVGIFTGFWTLNSEPPSLRWTTLLTVGVVGLLSFLRHSLLHRSDAARMGWDTGHRNNFQIEVGLANLAWGAVAVVAAVLNLSLAVDAVLLLVAGGYLTAVAVMLVVSPGEHRRPLPALLAIGSFGVLQLVLGIWGLTLA